MNLPTDAYNSDYSSACPGRVLLMDLSHQTGGASTRTLSLLAQLPKGMAALAVVEHSEVALAAQQAGFPVHVLGRRKTSMMLGSRLRETIIQGGFDIVDTQNAQSQFWAVAAMLPPAVAIVSTLNSWYRDEYGITPRGLIYDSIVRMTRSVTDHYIAVSTDIQERLKSSRVSLANVSTIPAAACVDGARVEDTRNALRTSLKLQAGDILLCSVGRLVAAKNYPGLIAALQRLPSHVHLVIVGSGPLKSTVEALVEQAGLSERVHFMGTIAHHEALSLIKASDVYVMTSTSEGTPMVLLEAAVLEKPIVATRVGGIPDLFPSGESAIIVEPDDPSALVEALLLVSGDLGAANDMGVRAGRCVKTTHSMDAMLHATLQAYGMAREHRARRRSGK
jgi:hypothetical protein